MRASLSTSTQLFRLRLSTPAAVKSSRPLTRIYSLPVGRYPLPATSNTRSCEFSTVRRFQTKGLLHQQQLWRSSTRIPPGTSAREPLRASISGLAVAALALGLGLALTFPYLRTSDKPADLPDDTVDITEDMSGAELAPGRPETLTAEQEEKLRQLWKLIFQVYGISTGDNGTAAAASSTPAAEPQQEKEEKKSRMSFFSRSKGKKEEADVAAPARGNGGAQSSVVLSGSHNGEDDKYGQTKHFYDTIASQSPESIRATIWSMVKHDHPDALVLRFLRARKWDVEKALVMFISTMNWRAQEMKVDEDIMRNGEGAAAEAEKSATADAALKKLSIDFLSQERMGKSYVHGSDKNGRPICYVRVRFHRQGEQCEESLERYTVYLIETCRMLLQPPVDTATIVFDMTGFSLANMDYTPVKFMIKCFEANYPECLGAVLVHKAPWVFQGIWKVIKGWLDPVVANKVHFTNNVADMSEFIDASRIPKELDGQDSWEYKFVEPVEGENDKMKDTATRDRLLAAREELIKQYEAETVKWIQNPGAMTPEIKARRNEIAHKLRDDYWQVDPYLRARSFYDRTGVLLPGGKVNFYPSAKKEDTEVLAEKVADVKLDAPVPVQTAADDVD